MESALLLCCSAAQQRSSAEQRVSGATYRVRQPDRNWYFGQGVLQAGDHSPQVVERARWSCSVVSVLDRAEDDAGVVDDA